MPDDLSEAQGGTPEKRALEAQWTEARRLRERVVQLELEKSTLEARLERFEVTWLHRLGDLYLRLDGLTAEWRELLASREPANEDLATKAKSARARAERTADDVAVAREKPERPPFRPEEELKALYRQAAREMHPDLAATDEEARLRHDYMVRLNAAFARGDEERIHQLRVEWESNLAPAEDEEEIGLALVRAIRVVDSLGRSIVRLDREIADMGESEVARLASRIEAARERGEHPLADLEREVQAQIDVLMERIRILRRDAGQEGVG